MVLCCQRQRLTIHNCWLILWFKLRLESFALTNIGNPSIYYYMKLILLAFYTAFQMIQIEEKSRFPKYFLLYVLVCPARVERMAFNQLFKPYTSHLSPPINRVSLILLHISHQYVRRFLSHSLYEWRTALRYRDWATHLELLIPTTIIYLHT